MARGYRSGAGGRQSRGRRGARARVRVRGSARELRVDGTWASHYEPGRVATGSVWDALALGLLALPPSRRRSVLLLGLGGGSAARIVRALAPDARIVGVEIDPEVVALARRWFDLDSLGVQVQVAEASAWLARCRSRFDAVIEDVFVGTERTLRKPPGFPEPALARAAGRLLPGGVLVCNALDEAPAVAATLRRLLPHLLRIELQGYDNRVLLASGRPLDGRRLRREAARSEVLGPTVPELRFRKLA